MRIRSGSVADVPVVMAMFDEAVAWMVARGNTEQWGTEPWSSDPHKVEAATRKLDRGTLWLAEPDGVPAGALVTSDGPPNYIEQAAEPELYVTLLITSRRQAGRGIGAQLLAHARTLAEQQAVHLIRVDCHRAPDESLIRYYEGNGFTRVRPFTVGDWPGQLLAQRLVTRP
jgi:GNAT superfamily N-acetyltransferase